jgi:hypothetical protein
VQLLPTCFHLLHVTPQLRLAAPIPRFLDVTWQATKPRNFVNGTEYKLCQRWESPLVVYAEFQMWTLPLPYVLPDLFLNASYSC